MNRRFPLSVLLAALIAAIFAVSAVSAQEITQQPKLILGGVSFSITIDGGSEESALVEIRDANGALLASGGVAPGASREFRDLVVAEKSLLPLTVHLGAPAEGVAGQTLNIPYAPAWFSLAPPFIAIILALLFKEVITALVAGVWIGVLAIAGYDPVQATWRLVDEYVIAALVDTGSGHIQILVFSLMLGGLVGIIGKNGGTLGIVEAVTPFANTRRRGKIATWIAGLCIFFDDYANTLIVGNTMRPITDRLKISREKLAFLVDSTAAPVAALVPISTWVGYEISLIADGVTATASRIGDPVTAAALTQLQPFNVFIDTIPYLFYPLLALGFVFLTSLMDRDFGPMARAEIRAASGGGLHAPEASLATDTSDSFLDAKEGVTRRWWNAAVPVLTVVLVVLGGLYTSGRAGVGAEASLRDIFGAADPFATLLWGSLAGVTVAALISVAQRILSVQECVDAWVAGVKSMMMAMIILTLAWALGGVVKDLGTAQFLTQVIGGVLSLKILPALVFLTAGAMAFATGTSWATMAILIPLVIPLAVSMAVGAGLDWPTQYSILLGTVASVLAGAIWGDHCSPISDTTVLSSMASGCDHIDHVKTQLPYAMLVGGVSVVVGSIGTAYGLPPWIALGIGALILFGVLKLVGTRAETADGP